MGSEASDRLRLPWVGGIDAGEETGSNKDKGNGWPQADDVDAGKWFATADVEGTATEEDISGGGKENVTWVA